jgi:hypothetical protein
MTEVPGSIWDGWKHQCYGVFTDGKARCARGWIVASKNGLFIVDEREDDPRVVDTYRRVAAWLRREILTPFTINDGKRIDIDDVEAIVIANNWLRLTPEQFRQIDRETQIAEAAEKLIASVEPLSEVEFAEVVF